MNKRKILLLSLISSLITTGFISLGASLIAGKDVYLHVANSRIFQINFIGGPILFSICFLIYMKLFKRVRPKTDDMPGRMIRSADLMHRMTKFAARWKYITLTIAIICAIPVLIITYRARKIQLAIVQLKVDNPQVNNWGQSHIRTRDFNDDSWSNSKDPIYLSHIDKFIDVVYLDGLLFDSLILYFGSPYISDISALKGLPIKSLDLNYCSLNELTVLKDMPLVYISLPHTTKNIDSLRSVKTLKNINNDTAEDFWKLHDIMKGPLEQLQNDNPQVKDWFRLQLVYQDALNVEFGTANLNNINALAGVPIKVLDLSGVKIKTISALSGMPLEILDLSGTQVEDISPLKGMKLTSLNLSGTAVSDISALKEMPLAYLNLKGISVSDISTLKAMPLNHLNLDGTPVTDITALKEMNFERLYLPANVENISELKETKFNFLYLHKDTKNIESLRSVDILFINDMRPDRFWKIYDETGKIPPAVY